MTDVRFIPDGKMIRVNFAYDPELVALLKDVVPGYARSYDGSTKTWTITEDHDFVLATAIEKLGHRVLRNGEGLPDTSAALPDLSDFFAATPDSDKAYASAKAHDILTDIPAQHQGKVFRAMARELYPDLYRR